MSDTTTTTTPAVKTFIPVDSPLMQAAGGQLYKINVETTASQVKTADGLNVETRLTTLERVLSGKAQTYVHQDIAERDAQVSLVSGDISHVLDASADDTVESGGATYIYMQNKTWRKLAENESMDIVFDWALLKDKPASTVAAIDLAVAKQHTHENIETLAHVSDDGAGNLLFKGKRINDGKAWVACCASEADIPANLADGGIVIINPTFATTTTETTTETTDTGNEQGGETTQP